MASYAGNISSVLDTAKQLGQNFHNDQVLNTERAQVNAVNYLKTLTNQAKEAGYSMAQMAKMNENGIKNALFFLSNGNRELADQKYQELLQGPTSGDQILQQKMDQEVQKFAKDPLLDQDYISKTTVVTPEKTITKEVAPAKENFLGYKDIVELAKKSNAQSGYDFGLEIYNKEAEAQGLPTYKSVEEWKNADSEAYKKWVGYKKRVLKEAGLWTDEEYNDPNSIVSSDDNIAFMNLLKSNAIENKIQPGNKPLVKKEILEAIYKDLKEGSVLRDSDKGYSSLGNGAYINPADQNKKQAVQNLVDTYLKGDKKDPSVLTPLKGWSWEELKPYFDASVKAPEELPEKDNKVDPLEALGISFFDNREGKTITETIPEKTETKETTETVKGFVSKLNDLNSKVLKSGGHLAAKDLTAIDEAYKKAEQDLAKSKSEEQRNLASANLMNAQMLQLMNQANAQSKVNPTLVDHYKTIYKQYVNFTKEDFPKKLKDPEQKAIYDSLVNQIINVGNTLGLNMQGVEHDFNKGFLKGDGTFKQVVSVGGVPPSNGSNGLSLEDALKNVQ